MMGGSVDGVYISNPRIGAGQSAQFSGRDMIVFHSDHSFRLIANTETISQRDMHSLSFAIVTDSSRIHHPDLFVNVRPHPRRGIEDSYRSFLP